MIKRLAGCVRQYKKDIIISVCTMVMAAVLEVLIPYLMANIIDYGITPGDMNATLSVGGMLVGASLLSLCLGLVSARFLASASAGFIKNVRKDLYYHITNFPFQSIDKFSTASLITRLTTDISSIHGAFSLMVRVCSRSPLIMLFSLFMAFRINSQLALIFLFVLPLLGILIYIIIRIAFPLFRKALKTYDQLNSAIGENLKGIRVVKSFVREDFETEKLKKVSKNMQDTFTKAEKIVAFFNPTMQFAIYLCTILLAWFGAHHIVIHGMSIGQLMSLIIYINHILFALIMISMLFINLAMSRASAERIVEVFDEEIVLKNPDNPITEIPNGDITFENVGFGYSPGKLVLEDINLHIKSGQTIGVLGGTGSSKTSLVQLIPRLYDTVQGAIKVGGIDVRQLDMATLRNHVSMVLQKNTLFTGTVSANLKWGNTSATQEELEQVCKMAMAHDFVMGLEDKYETYIDQGGVNLSGGQRQRLCIARALLKRPKIIIFDDSTSAVDTSTEGEILKSIKETLPTTTKIIISQRISTVQNLDTILLMHNRKIIASGTHQELLATNEIYQEIYNSQSKEEDRE
ncbi:MAG: ABC transporter ATP-binding protein/permease [Defluviitaleaceae bacterium]|nr:ABC transporter ATP-binding protein/permease [Defluviitaleaceae bacterium]